MCGRFTLTLEPADLQAAFPDFLFSIPVIPRYNIAPSQPILVIPNDGTRQANFFKWGLIPSWLKDPRSFSTLINARSETAAEKPSFRGAMRHRRCLVPTTGFYEWTGEPGRRRSVLGNGRHCRRWRRSASAPRPRSSPTTMRGSRRRSAGAFPGSTCWKPSAKPRATEVSPALKFPTSSSRAPVSSRVRARRSFSPTSISKCQTRVIG